MRFHPRNLFLALALGAFTLTATSSWAGTMSVSQAQVTPGSQPMQPQTGNKMQTRIESIRGTLVKSGDGYALQATNGQEYQLFGASHAKSYVGKSVIVTGSVNTSSLSIEVQSIQPQ